MTKTQNMNQAAKALERWENEGGRLQQRVSTSLEKIETQQKHATLTFDALGSPTAQKTFGGHETRAL